MNDAARASIDAVVSPLEGEDPGGWDIRHEDDFFRLDELAGRVIRQGERAEELVTAAEFILANRSKDLKAAALWVYGLQARDGFQGLAAGLSAIVVLLRDCWQYLYPRSERGRRSSIDFINDRVAEQTAYLKPAQEEADLVGTCWRETKAIQPLLAERFAAPPPSLSHLAEVLDNTYQQLTGASPAPAEPTPSASPSVKTAPSSPGEPASATLQEGASTAEQPIESLGRFLSPIPGAESAGQDPRASDDAQHPFFGAENLWNNLTTGTGESGGDWAMLASACERVLAEHAKDLHVSVWLAIALYRRDGFPGLLMGLRILDGIITRFGDDCHPGRERARIGAVRLLNSKLAEFIRLIPPPQSDPETLRQLHEIVERIPENLAPIVHGGSEPVSLGELKSLIDDLAVQATPSEVPERETRLPPSPATPAQPPAQAAEQVPQQPAAAPPAFAPATTDTKISPTDAESQLVRYAEYLRSAFPEYPMSYRLLRMAVWGGVQALPEASGGVTRLGLEPRQVQRLEIMLKSEQPSAMDIIELCEGLLAEGGAAVYWLDLNRVSYEALSKLGDQYKPAAYGVAVETGLFVRRLEGIERLSFSDQKTRFADGTTVQWLNQEVKPLLGAGAGPAVASAFELSLLEPVEKAFASEVLGEAMDLFYAWYSGLGPGPLKIHAALAASRHLLTKQEVHLARSILAALETEMRALHAEIWVPDLCLLLWSQLHQCNLNLAEARRQQRREHEAAALESADHELLGRMIALDWKQVSFESKQ